MPGIDARAWALCVLLCISAVAGYGGTNARLIGPPVGQYLGHDFRACVRAAGDVRAGARLYARSRDWGLVPDMRKFLGWDDGAAYFVYPPPFALALVPFVPLGEDALVRGWAWVCLSLLAATALLLVHLAIGVHPFRVPRWSLLSLVLVLTHFPAQHVLAVGNVDALLLFLLALTYWLYSRNSLLAAVSLAIAVTIKPQLALVGAYFAWKREWRLVLLAGATTVGLLLLGFSAIGWHQLRDYVHVNRLYTVETAMRAYPLNQALFGLSLRAFSPNSYIEPAAIWPRITWLLPTVVGMLAVVSWLLTTSTTDNRRSPVNLVEFGLTLTTLALILPYFGANQVVWLLLPLSVLFLMSAAAATPHTGRAFQCVTLLLVVYMGHPDLHDAIWKGWEAIAFDHRLVGRRFLALTGAYLYGLMLLHALLLLHLRRARRAEAAFHVGMPGPDEHPGSALASATDPGFHEVHSPTGHR